MFKLVKNISMFCQKFTILSKNCLFTEIFLELGDSWTSYICNDFLLLLISNLITLVGSLLVKIDVILPLKSKLRGLLRFYFDKMLLKVYGFLTSYFFSLPFVGVCFSKVFFVTMGREWHGIDRLRLDKFYMVKKFPLVYHFA